MLITTELLRKYKACEQGIEYIQRFYPNGAEMIDIIHDPNIDKEFLYWGRKNLTHSAEEFDAYCHTCNIVNTDCHWCSYNLHDSNFIVESHDIENSERIFESNDIEHSFDVVASESISNSSQIFTSSLVDNSSHIMHCSNITECNNTCFSKIISHSENIYNSKNVFTSSEIITSENVTNSYFCQNCRNIKHCMFCDGIEDVEYYLFNQPVDKERFELFTQQYKRFMQFKLAFAPIWPENMIKAFTPVVTQKKYEWYNAISEKFWKWAKTLPGYDYILVYNITLIPEILIAE